MQGFSATKLCRDGRKDCSDTDCQRIHPKDSVTMHFTFYNKPWDCSEGNQGTVVTDTCLGLLKEWYGIRRELEDWWLLLRSDSAASKSDSLDNINRLTGMVKRYLRWKSRKMALWIMLNILDTVMILERKDIIDS